MKSLLSDKLTQAGHIKDDYAANNKAALQRLRGHMLAWGRQRGKSEEDSERISFLVNRRILELQEAALRAGYFAALSELCEHIDTARDIAAQMRPGG